MSLRKLQSEFALAVSELIQHAYSLGYEITFGDAYAKTGHISNSQHYKRLAIDLNLFRNGKYLTSTEDHRVLGEWWVEQHPRARWGGNFRRKDGNHYEFY